MPLRDGRDDRGLFDREILDIIPERYDADPDSRHARKSAHTRLILTAALALLAVAALGVATRHILFDERSSGGRPLSVPVIHADDKPIKTKPQDRGGMDVPNQDKLVYERMGANEAEPQPERLLPPPEQPQTPPSERKPSIKPAFPTPPNLPATLPAPAEPPPETAPAPATAATGSKPPPAAPPAGKPAPTPAAPAAAKSPPAAVVASAAAPAAKGGTWLVQLSAMKSEAEAKADWTRLKGLHKDLLGDLSSDIVRVDLGTKGIFWRLRAGPLEESQARALCTRLASQNQGCIVAHR